METVLFAVVIGVGVVISLILAFRSKARGVRIQIENRDGRHVPLGPGSRFR